ncbi:MAG: THUMP domain-containing protein [Paludibacteraceae bacterium]|nr:THUMP domain-containing protein [Paludibacteraceae bacterium]
MEFKMVAKTFKGLEEVLAKELIDLGANDVQIERRAVSFTGDKAMMYRANLCLRTASRVLKPILTFHAKDADEVYERVKRFDWSELMDINTTFAIDATVFSESFRHSGYVTYRVKDAIVDYFTEKSGKRPSVKVSSPDLMINVHIAGEDVTLSLDSSGESLHKRGWREATTEAPINEALAAGMLLMAGWQGQCDFYDPMCGSGTFLIEAAMIARGIAPGIYRQSFAFEKWRDFERDLFQDIYDDDSREREFCHHIYGSDASFYCTKVAEKNIAAAGLQKDVTVRMCRIQDLKPELPESGDTPKAMIVTNPPYGERIGTNANIQTLYREIGNVFKQRFADCIAWVISSNEDAMKCIGLKPSQKLPLLNGELECKFNSYELFRGDHKEFKTKVANGEIRRAPSSEFQHHKYKSHKRPERSQRPIRGAQAERTDRPSRPGRFNHTDRSSRPNRRTYGRNSN